MGTVSSLGKKNLTLFVMTKYILKKIHMLILPNFDLLGRRTGSLVAMFIEKARESWSSKPICRLNHSAEGREELGLC